MPHELLPCPFCGAQLVPNNSATDFFVRRYGPYYNHPDDSCLLAGIEVPPSQHDEWNTRTFPGVGNVSSESSESKQVDLPSGTHSESASIHKPPQKRP